MSEQQEQQSAVPEGLTVTRAEAEARVRAQGLRCRGPNKAELSPRDWQRLAPSMQDALGKAVPTQAEGEPKRTVRQMIDGLLQGGYKAEARALDEFSRIPCGADFGELVVLKQPMDGTRQAYKCPKCGLEGVYDAPLFNITE